MRPPRGQSPVCLTCYRVRRAQQRVCPEQVLRGGDLGAPPFWVTFAWNSPLCPSCSGVQAQPERGCLLRDPALRCYCRTPGPDAASGLVLRSGVGGLVPTAGSAAVSSPSSPPTSATPFPQHGGLTPGESVPLRAQGGSMDETVGVSWNADAAASPPAVGGHPLRCSLPNAAVVPSPCAWSVTGEGPWSPWRPRSRWVARERLQPSNHGELNFKLCDVQEE